MTLQIQLRKREKWRCRILTFDSSIFQVWLQGFITSWDSVLERSRRRRSKQSSCNHLKKIAPLHFKAVLFVDVFMVLIFFFGFLGNLWGIGEKKVSLSSVFMIMIFQFQLGVYSSCNSPDDDGNWSYSKQDWKYFLDVRSRFPLY